VELRAAAKNGRRFREAFSRGLAFIIVSADNIEHASEQIQDLCSPYLPRIIVLRLLDEDTNIFIGKLVKTLDAIFGLPSKKFEELPSRIGDVTPIDIIVAETDRTYRNFIEEMLQSTYLMNIAKEVSPKESEDHIALKVLSVKYLVEKAGTKPDGIICNYPFNEKVIADLYVKSEGTAIEVETLFGTGPSPILKILESVRKYMNVYEVRKILIVLGSWAVALHLGDLYYAEHLLRKELERQVKILIPDLERKTLKSLDEVISQLRNLLQ